MSTPLVSESTVSRPGPASSTPVSSNVSRTAATTSPRASDSSQPMRLAHSAGDGPAHGTSSVTSLGCMPPPGNTYMPAANAMLVCRRIRYASMPSAPSRTTMIVAAWRGSTTMPL